jgi:Mg-chelatase subunit ChlD
MTTLPRSLVLFAIALTLTPAVTAQKPDGKPKSRTVFVGVTDRRGEPILDLAASDFEVTEASVKRTIMKAELAKSPMRIALMVDTSDAAAPAMQHVRTGLVDLIDAVPAPHEIMLVSTGRQTRVRVAPTADHKKVRDAAGGLFGEGGATPLRDGLLEIDERYMRKAEDRWPVFVIVTSDGAEGSGDAVEKRFNNWVSALRPRGIVVHAIALKYRGGGLPEAVAAAVAETSGGAYDFINTSNSLPGKLKAIAERMMFDYERVRQKYEITFASDSADLPIAIGVARDGAKVDTRQGRLR